MKKPTLDDLIQSEVSEARRVRAFLNGLDISQDAPLWLAPGIPSHYNAVRLAKHFGIQRERVTVKSSTNRNGQTLYFAVVTCRRANTTRAGASCSSQQDIAVEFAFRNSVRQLLTGTLTKKQAVWRDERKRWRRYA